MRKSKFLLPFLGALICSFSFTAAAADFDNQQAAPPKLEPLEEGVKPTVTISDPSQQKSTIREKKINGETEKVKVSTKGSTYYLEPKGNASNINESETRVPKWKVKEFGVGAKKKPETSDLSTPSK